MNILLGHCIYNSSVFINPSINAVIISEEINVSTYGKESAYRFTVAVIVSYLINIFKFNGKIKSYSDRITIIKNILNDHLQSRLNL